MALQMASSAAQAPLMNGTASPSPEENEELYAQLCRLQDVVLAGEHPRFKLPPSAVEQLKAALVVQPSAPSAGGQDDAGIGIVPNTKLPQQHAQSPSSFSQRATLPGLQNANPVVANGASPFPATTSATPAAFDPIFLQKADHLVKAETRLRRQKLERALQAQADSRKHSARDKDVGIDGPSRFDVDLVLLSAMTREKHTCGLRTRAKSAASSSFDENDYYSSQVQSDWSSNASSAKASDRATGAFHDDFERLDGASSKRSVKPTYSMPDASKQNAQPYDNAFEDAYGVEDDEDEYMPPDAAAIDTSRFAKTGAASQRTPPERDSSDHAPGDAVAESNYPSPLYQAPQAAKQPPANVPVIRNHLTYIAAPQPNRVSPLTTAHNSGVELELVNGKPEVVHRAPPRQRISRVSSASPSGFGGQPHSKKKNNNKKKRKRDNSSSGRSKRRNRNHGAETANSPDNQEAYIKDEPLSPPPSVADVPQYGQPYASYAPAQIDLTQPRLVPQSQYMYDPQRSASHIGYTEPQRVIRVASPAQRPLQGETQDLRRVASMQYAQRPHSRSERRYSPVAPYRAASMAHGDPRLQPRDVISNATQAPYAPQEPASSSMRPRSRSPAQMQRFQDAYSSRAASPALMPPPPAPPARRIVQDQYGNRYYAAEPAPGPQRASMVPEGYERAPSRAAYAQSQAMPNYYEPADAGMPPPPLLAQRQTGREESFEYTDADGYLVRGTRIRPAEQQQPRYSGVPTSPSYQDYRGYEQMPPPPPPQVQRQTHEPTSPTFNPNASRSYSVRPEEPAQAPTYLRQASVAPVQYMPMRQGSVAPMQYASQARAQPAPPPRAVSVMPGYEYGPPQTHIQSQQGYAPAPQEQAPRFVDQYGNAVFPGEVREVRQDEYYQG